MSGELPAAAKTDEDLQMIPVCRWLYLLQTLELIISSRQSSGFTINNLKVITFQVKKTLTALHLE